MRNTAVRLLCVVPFAALLLAAKAFTVSPDAQAAAVAVQTTKLADTLFMLEGKGGNIGVCVAPDGVLMIDDEFADIAPQIQSAIDALAPNAGAPKYLINTHFHGDHTGANAVFGKRALIVAHDSVRARLLDAKPEPMAPSGLPTVTFNAQLSLHHGAQELRLTHYPHAHTDGDVVVEFIGANAWQLGDLFFNERFPFIDLSAGGSVDGLVAGVDDVLAKMSATARIIPGHGAPARKVDLERYRDMLVDCRRIVAAALAAGQSREQIVAAKLLAPYDAWSWSFVSSDKFAHTLASSLTSAMARK